jgi:uncharacterized protein (TIGR03790 family)
MYSMKAILHGLFAWSSAFRRSGPTTRANRLKAGLQTRLALASFVLLLAAFASAAPSGDEVVVVYNKKAPGSEDVARHYAAVRRVPKDQVIGLNLSATEEISRAEYEDSLANPLARELEKRKLWRMGTRSWPVTNATDLRPLRMPVESRIRYAVLCYGVPLRIRSEATLHEPGEENVRPELRRNEAAVDSELAALPLPAEVRMKFGLLRNPYYTTTNAAMLSPTNGILLIARLDGPTAEIARSLVDKAIAAETNGYWGRAYCDIRGITTSDYKMGDDWIRGAFDICRVMGFEGHLDTNAATIPASLPMSQIAFYAGWYEPNACGPFLAPQMEFMPGAFAYHLHSANAWTIRSTSNGWVGPLLARGATCSMGSVYEPYLMGTPDIGTFAARWLIGGFTFGEAAYACQNALSWQTTVVGDPLYRAFAMNPQLLHLKLERTGNPLVAWSHLRVANMNLVRGTPLLGVIGFLESLPLTKESAVLMEKLADLYGTVGKPTSTVYAYQQALKLDPTPQQRIRVYLKLGEQLAAQNRNDEAEKTYRALLDEFPAYPGRTEVEATLAKLALKPATPAETNSIKSLLDSMPRVPATNGAAK